MSAVELPAAVDMPGRTTSPMLRTLVLCELVNVATLSEALGPQAAADLVRRHDRMARELMQRHHGREIEKAEGFLVMFERPIQAVAYALSYQRELRAAGREAAIELRARVGIHVGDVLVWENVPSDVAQGAKPIEIEGMVKPVAARLAALALPGQTLASGVACSLAQRAHGELGDVAQRSRWVGHGRYRFKGVPEPLPVHEIGEDGVAPFRPPPWSSKAHREVPWWRRPASLAAEIALLLGVIGTTAWLTFQPPPAVAFAQRDWVVVGSLKNLTDERRFDDSLQTAMRIGLEQSQYVNVVPDLQVRDALRRMERDPGKTEIDRKVGAEVAQREGAKALILPSLSEANGQVRVTAEVVDPLTGSTIYSESVSGAGVESVLPSADALLKKLRGRLGESMASISKTSMPLEKVTTSNLDALQAYSLAARASVEGRVSEGLALLDHAVTLDPRFAQAYLLLTNTYYSNGQRAKARDNIVKATSNLDRLSARDRLFAEGYAAFFDSPSALREKWSLYATLYPDAVSGQQNLALGQLWFDNDLVGAAKNFQAAAESRHPRRAQAWKLLGDTQLAMGQVEAARRSYEIAQGFQLPQLTLSPINLWIATRDYAAADAALARETNAQYPYLTAERYLRVASLEVSRGRFDEAAVAVAQTLRIAQDAGLESSAERAKLAQVVIAYAREDKEAAQLLRTYTGAELKRLHIAASAYDYSSYTYLSYAAMLALRHGEESLAREILAALEPTAATSAYFSIQQPYRIAACEAQIADNAARAVKCLEALKSDRSYFQTYVALLHAYQAAGMSDKALSTAEWLSENRGKAAAEWLDEFAGQTLNVFNSDEAAVTAAGVQLANRQSAAALKLLVPLELAWNGSSSNSALRQRMRAMLESARK